MHLTSMVARRAAARRATNASKLVCVDPGSHLWFRTTLPQLATWVRKIASELETHIMNELHWLLNHTHCCPRSISDVTDPTPPSYKPAIKFVCTHNAVNRNYRSLHGVVFRMYDPIIYFHNVLIREPSIYKALPVKYKDLQTTPH